MRGLGKSFLCAAAVLSSAILATSAGWAANATGAGALGNRNVEQVIVTGERDAALVGRVEMALKADRYLYAEHVNVLSKNGVVTLEGMVADPWDLRTALRLAASVPGVRSVVDNLELYGDGSTTTG